MVSVTQLILVPQGAEYQAVCQGLSQASITLSVLPIPVGTKALTQYLQQMQQAEYFSGIHQVLVMGLGGSLRSRFCVGNVVVYQDCVYKSETASPRISLCDRTLTALLVESNVTITAEVVLLHKIWGTDKTRSLHKVENYLRSQQREHGGWELFYGDGGELSTSVEAYMALKLLGVPETDQAMQQAGAFILKHGGISRTRIFTKLHLALIGCYDWRGIPSIPPWVMLLPSTLPINIYEMSSWARGSTVPLLIVFVDTPRAKAARIL